MEGALKPGTPVTIATLTGPVGARRVVRSASGVVYVTTEAEYRRAEAAGDDPAIQIGFPPEDVVFANVANSSMTS